MAEIRIEQKRRGPSLLWLFVALVVVAVLAWYFLYPGRRGTPAPAAAPPTTGALEMPERAAHLSFVVPAAAPGRGGESGGSHG